MFVYNKMTKGGILACMIIIYWKKDILCIDQKSFADMYPKGIESSRNKS